jgi:RNA polymerase sigma-70 factor (ECF subfamily)
MLRQRAGAAHLQHKGRRRDHLPPCPGPDATGQIEALAVPRGDASGTLSVQQAMARLPEDQRLAVALVLIEGLPYKEAAQIIGVPMGG